MKCKMSFLNLNKIVLPFQTLGLAMCNTVDTGTKCRKVFRVTDLERHQKESHAKYLCPACICEFPSEKLRNVHIQCRHKGVDFPTSEPCTDEEEWVQPLDKEAIMDLSVKTSPEPEEEIAMDYCDDAYEGNYDDHSETELQPINRNERINTDNGKTNM
jgi:hypothetical protein